MFGEPVLTTERACRKIVEVWTVRFDYRKACQMFVELSGACCNNHKARIGLADVWRVRVECR